MQELATSFVASANIPTSATVSNPTVEDKPERWDNAVLILDN
jgi:hypothetical protein